MQFLTRTFFKGLAVVLPVAASIYVILWLAEQSEGISRLIAERVLPPDVYLPGAGIAVLLAGIFAVGLLMYSWLTRQLIEGAERLFRKIPIVASIYGPVRDLVDLFGDDIANKFGQVVRVQVPNTEMYTLGFITRDDAAGLPDGLLPDGHVVVFVQWSSQVGGYCFIVPEDSVTPIEMSVQDGMRWALTGGVSAPQVPDEAAA